MPRIGKTSFSPVDDGYAESLYTDYVGAEDLDDEDFDDEDSDDEDDSQD